MRSTALCEHYLIFATFKETLPTVLRKEPKNAEYVVNVVQCNVIKNLIKGSFL
jgi:hypothetical protein